MATAEGLSKTVSRKGKRYYDVGIGLLLPSVTTILGTMTDKSGLDQWRAKIGAAKADAISTKAANRGTVMHQMIEYFLLSPYTERGDRLRDAQLKTAAFVLEKEFTEEEAEIGRKLFYNFYNWGSFDAIAEVVSIEETLHSTKAGGYAGRVDTIYRKKTGELVISDYKTSRKPKKTEWIENYFMQAAAYYVAYWEMTGEQPGSCEIWISNEEDAEPQIFIMNRDEIRVHAHAFLKLVSGFHKSHLREDI
jgi:genome maintenance exonuclease 1